MRSRGLECRRGLQALEEEPPDLILLDVMMPQVDGWEMLRRVQERHGVGAIPVIMFSGKVDEQSLKAAASRGAQGFIGKPSTRRGSGRVHEAARSCAEAVAGEVEPIDRLAWTEPR